MFYGREGNPTEKSNKFRPYQATWCSSCVGANETTNTSVHVQRKIRMKENQRLRRRKNTMNDQECDTTDTPINFVYLKSNSETTTKIVLESDLVGNFEDRVTAHYRRK